ncbi:hypothetical protein FACS1894201_01480 [Bacteroidia bacterium]|nr:hypothetical protein FACS1894201_01480 [Bacteroidia bacterium]
MLVTLFGIVKLPVKPLHPSNAYCPMLVTPDCITTVLTDDLTEYHGTADADDQFVIAPVPLIVKVPLLRVAVI